jgi:UDP-glucose 4-epimerase
MKKTRKKVLITGGSGFIGHNLIETLSSDYRIFHPDSRELDLLDDGAVEKYLQKHRFDVIIHAATHNSTRVSSKDLKMVFSNNIRMFITLARCSKYYGRMFYFGSGAQYDVNHYIPKMKEEYFDMYLPTDNYGFSKYIMSKYTDIAKNIYDLRLFGVFGKYEDWRIRFISNAICRVLYDLDITISQNVYFDYLYINDLTHIMQILIDKKTIPYHHINVCTGKTIDLLSLANKVQILSKTKHTIKIAKKGLKKEYSGDNSKLLSIIGKYQFTAIDRAIFELYEWYKVNLRLIDKKYLQMNFH